jgi:hypothetical protein
MKKAVFIGLCWGIFCAPASAAGLATKVDKNDKAPSSEQVLWTETDLGYNFETAYDFVAPARVDFGSGRAGDVSQHYTSLRHVFTTRELMAFLYHAGINWQRRGFAPPRNVLLPNELHSLELFLATDFRWSENHMVRLQLQPGFFSDMNDVTTDDLNMPLAIAYTHIPSRRFQWAVGLSINTWRGSRFVPGGGFRYYMTKKWKLKFMLPQPQIEYRARPNLHLSLGADFRGDTFRVSRSFGDRNGVQSLNNALVNYQEIRVGAGFSWNIKPLIALQGNAGWMFEREFDYHNAGYHSSGHGAPYVGLTLKTLWQIKADKRPIPAQIRSMQVEFPFIQRFINK